VRRIEYKTIVSAVRRLCIDSCYLLPGDVYGAISDAAQKETNTRAKRILCQLLENADIAKNERIPLCQDTGLTVVFVEQGQKLLFEPPADAPDATIIDAINEGVRIGYQEGFLRKSVVAEPLCERENTNTNTPAIVHYSIVQGDSLKIGVMCKGGGCENKSAFKMFNPTTDKDEIIDWVVETAKQAGANACPPFVVGVGIGGDFEQCCLISKKALMREMGKKHPNRFYAKIEEEILTKINLCGFGAQGLGGDISAIGVMVETAPCHIASLPVAVNIECHAHRHKNIRL
jgi:fumarate hydratase subunit alpha